MITKFQRQLVLTETSEPLINAQQLSKMCPVSIQPHITSMYLQCLQSLFLFDTFPLGKRKPTWYRSQLRYVLKQAPKCSTPILSRNTQKGVTQDLTGSAYSEEEPWTILADTGSLYRVTGFGRGKRRENIRRSEGGDEDRNICGPLYLQTRMLATVPVHVVTNRSSSTFLGVTNSRKEFLCLYYNNMESKNRCPFFLS